MTVAIWVGAIMPDPDWGTRKTVEKPSDLHGVEVAELVGQGVAQGPGEVLRSQDQREIRQNGTT